MAQNINDSGSNNPKVIPAYLSEKLSAVGLLAAILVVLLHSYNQNLVLRMDSISCWVQVFLSRGVCSIAVPMFFAISGYLLGAKYYTPWKNWYKNLWHKRLHSLVIPYILWCSIYALTFYPFTIYGNHLANREWFHNTSFADISLIRNFFRIYGSDFYSVPADGPLWFIRNLFILLAISPLFFKLLPYRKLYQVFLLLTATAYFFHDFIPNPAWQFFESGFSIRGLLFFGFGIYFCRYPVYISGSTGKIKYLLWVLWLILLLAGSYIIIVQTGNLWLRLIPKAGIICGVAAGWYSYELLFSRFTAWKKWPIAEHEFFIYAGHYAIMGILFCQKSMTFLLNLPGSSDIAVYFLRFTVTLFIATLCGVILKRIFPIGYFALSGRR